MKNFLVFLFSFKEMSNSEEERNLEDDEEENSDMKLGKKVKKKPDVK
jgi:hypothetical protein